MNVPFVRFASVFSVLTLVSMCGVAQSTDRGCKHCRDGSATKPIVAPAAACETCSKAAKDSPTVCERCGNSDWTCKHCSMATTDASGDSVSCVQNRKTQNTATLVVQCPPQARIIIDGHLTGSTGTTREFRLNFDAKVHAAHVQVLSRDPDEKVNYEYNNRLNLPARGTHVLSLTHELMLAKPDKQDLERIEKLLSDGTVLKVTQDKKLEIVRNDVQQSTLLSLLGGLVAPSKTSAPLKEAKAAPTKSVNLQTVAVKYLQEELDRAKSDANLLETKIIPMQERYEAATRLRKVADYDLQTKQVETKATTATKLDEEKALIKLHQARDVEQSARQELHGGQEAVNEARKKVRSLTDQLKQAQAGFIRIDLP